MLSREILLLLFGDTHISLQSGQSPNWSKANRYARLEIVGIKLAQATINNSLNFKFTLIS